MFEWLRNWRKRRTAAKAEEARVEVVAANSKYEPTIRKIWEQGKHKEARVMAAFVISYPRCVDFIKELEAEDARSKEAKSDERAEVGECHQEAARSGKQPT